MILFRFNIILIESDSINTLNLKLSNSQLNKLKSAIRNRTQVILNLSANLIKNSNDKTNFPHKLLLTNTQVLEIH